MSARTAQPHLLRGLVALTLAATLLVLGAARFDGRLHALVCGLSHDRTNGHAACLAETHGHHAAAGHDHHDHDLPQAPQDGSVDHDCAVALGAASVMPEPPASVGSPAPVFLPWTLRTVHLASTRQDLRLPPALGPPAHRA